LQHERTLALECFPLNKLRHTKGGVFIMGQFVDSTGKKFGMLTAIKRDGVSNGGVVIWLCKCDCGNETHVYGSHLRNGHTISCGCYNREFNQKTLFQRSVITHHMSGTRPYKIWFGIIKRCNNPKSKSYVKYGARGIAVCDKWLTFEGFWEDMQEGYSDDLSIDRINVNGNYNKINCRWATNKEQCNNRRNNVIIDYGGEKYTLIQLSEKYKIQYDVLRYRLIHKWPIEKALQLL
jgi:hypothetical protein